jgi:hypothetical protein
MPKLKNIDFITLLLITIWGIIQGQVTVFYIVYLYWFQEFIRTIVDFNFLFRDKVSFKEKFDFLKNSFGSFFLLFIYFVFIVLLFGVMLNFNNSSLLTKNLSVLTFRNTFFNLNISLFLLEYIYFRRQSQNIDIPLQIFNRRHIILHLSIILGALLQLVVAPKLNIDSVLASAFIILPFLLLKWWIEKPMSNISR